LYIQQPRGLWRYRAKDERLTLVTSADLKGGRFVAVSRDGRLLGIRGEDYFVVKPGDSTLDLRTIPGESAPRTLHFLRAGPKGRIWGGPPFGQTLFWVDPARKKVVNTGTVSDTGGEVYDVAFVGDATYAAAYSGGDIIRYHPDQPWDQWNQKNPKTIASIGTKGFIRPTGGIVLGARKRLYAGWTAGSGSYGGAVSMTNPTTGDTELLENPLGQQQITGVASDDSVLYVGTGLGGSGLPAQPGQSPKLGIIDPLKKTVLWQLELKGAARVRPLGYDSKTRLVPTAVDTQIRLFKPATRAFVNSSKTLPPLGSWVVGVPGDGGLYYGSGKRIVRLDLASGVVETLAEAPAAVNNVTVGPDGTVYAGAGVNLYVVRRRGK
jgi:hypothetical protein